MRQKAGEALKKNSLIRICLIILAIIGILDTLIISSRSGGKDFGILLPAIGGSCIILWLLFTRTSFYLKNIKFFNRLVKLFKGVLIIWAVSFAAVLIVIVNSAISNTNEKVECVIVLGAGLKGEVPTLVLLERLNYTLDYLERNPGTKVIVSGGQGPGETITEAEAMKRFLVRYGVPQESIIKEEQSTSTFENMVFSKRLYEKTYGKSLNKVMIITNDFHMFRSKMLAKRAGLNPYGISSATPWYIYPNVFLREYLAVFKSLIFDR